MLKLIVSIIVVIITIPRRARLRLSRRLELDESIIVWSVLAVEVVVVGLRGGLLDLILGAVVVVLPLGLRAVVGALDTTSVVGCQELVHRVVRRIFVLGVGDNVAMLELIVSIIVVI